MTRIVAVLLVLSAAGCLPTRNGTPFEDGTSNNAATNNTATNNTATNNTATNNNVADMGNPNNVVTDMGNPNNVTPDMANPNNVTPDLGPDACVPEDDAMFCERQGAACGSFTSADNCGVMRTTDCGACPGGGACMNNVCEGCTPEDNATFCQRLGAECGQLSALDNCRMQRQTNCGGCGGNGVSCNLSNTCVESDCRDGVDNDSSMGADCADTNCLGQSCGQGNRVCQSDGACRN